MQQTQDPVIAKLEQLEARFAEIERQIFDPAVACDPAKVIPLSKEQGKLRTTVERFREYRKCQAEIEQAMQMEADGSGDPELREMAREEIARLTPVKTRLYEDIRDTLVMSDDSAIASVILEVRAGTGGEEAALFARDLYNMYTRYCDAKGWKSELLSYSPSDMGGLREVIVNVEGPGVWAHLGYEGGGHRVQRVPETEAQGRIHTSAATVAVLPEPEEVDVYIKPEDVVEQVCRSGGAGGQNVNKVNSAIRLEHIPTGITVSMRDERSQHKNRAKAWRILRSRIYDLQQGKISAERDQKRKTMIGSGDRSQRIRTYNFPQNRVTDHRINVSLYNLDKFILGDMDEMIKALMDFDKQQRLANL
jgi:peptide chain release factor 1